MNRHLLTVCLLTFSGTWTATAAAQTQGYDELRGHWQVVELVDNGRVIPKESIPTWLPSGGYVEVVDNTLLLVSKTTGERHTRRFAIDAASYPKTIDLISNDQVYGYGIYRFDEGRLVVCLSPRTDAPRPTDFSAREGSNRAMMVLERTTSPAPATSQTIQTSYNVAIPPKPNLPPPPDIRVTSAPTGAVLTDAQVLGMLPGTWKCVDAYGALYLTLNANGTYSTFRETVDTSTLQKAFARVPVSSGTWSLNNGQVFFHCLSATQPERINKNIPFHIRSVTNTDLVFVDYAGQTARAVRSP